MKCAMFCRALTFSVGLFLLQPPSASLEEALSGIENWKREFGTAELNRWMETIRTEGSRGDPLLWERLYSVVRREDTPTPVRSEALKGACALANADQAGRLVAQLAEWSAEVAREGVHQSLARDGRLAAEVLLVATGLTEGLADLQSVVDDQREILRMLTAAAKEPLMAMRTRPYRAIAESPAPLELRRESALEVIAATPSSL